MNEKKNNYYIPEDNIFSFLNQRNDIAVKRVRRRIVNAEKNMQLIPGSDEKDYNMAAEEYGKAVEGMLRILYVLVVPADKQKEHPSTDTMLKSKELKAVIESDQFDSALTKTKYIKSGKEDKEYIRVYETFFHVKTYRNSETHDSADLQYDEIYAGNETPTEYALKSRRYTYIITHELFKYLYPSASVPGLGAYSINATVNAYNEYSKKQDDSDGLKKEVASIHINKETTSGSTQESLITEPTVETDNLKKLGKYILLDLIEYVEAKGEDDVEYAETFAKRLVELLQTADDNKEIGETLQKVLLSFSDPISKEQVLKANKELAALLVRRRDRETEIDEIEQHTSNQLKGGKTEEVPSTDSSIEKNERRTDYYSKYERSILKDAMSEYGMSNDKYDVKYASDFEKLLKRANELFQTADDNKEIGETLQKVLLSFSDPISKEQVLKANKELAVLLVRRRDRETEIDEIEQHTSNQLKGGKTEEVPSTDSSIEKNERRTDYYSKYERSILKDAINTYKNNGSATDAKFASDFEAVLFEANRLIQKAGDADENGDYYDEAIQRALLSINKPITLRQINKAIMQLTELIIQLKKRGL